MPTISVPNPCLGAGIEKRPYPTTWYGVRQPFVPSNLQLKNYAAFFKHQTYSNHKTGNATFDDEAVQKLIKKYPQDPLYKLLGDYAELQKAKTTYVDGKGFQVGPDERVHGKFNWNPSTGRFASDDPNMQNIPTGRESEIYKAIRNLFWAQQGRKFVGRDYSGIEAKLVMYLAQDPAGVRLTDLGVHDYFTSHVIKQPADLSWSDEDLRAYFKDIKAKNKNIRETCKRVIHLSHYLGTPTRIHELYPEHFPTRKDAAYYQDFYLDLFPSIRKWQLQTCLDAEEEGFLACPDGFRHDFFQVFSYKRIEGKWCREYGPDAKRAVAFRPQHLALTYMARALVQLNAENDWFEDVFRLTIHDEIFTEPKVEDWEWQDRIIAKTMERPLEILPLPRQWGMGEALFIASERKGPADRWGEMS